MKTSVLTRYVSRSHSRSPTGVEIHLHLCFGQKNKITRRWARRGTRPSAPRDQRTKSAYIFGAICPARGTGLVLPHCNTQAMQWHLDEIATQVAPGAHAVVMLVQAGWHTSGKLDVPDNMTLLPLPPRSPELNPVENIWLAIVVASRFPRRQSQGGTNSPAQRPARAARAEVSAST